MYFFNESIYLLIILLIALLINYFIEAAYYSFFPLWYSWLSFFTYSIFIGIILSLQTLSYTFPLYLLSYFSNYLFLVFNVSTVVFNYSHFYFISLYILYCFSILTFLDTSYFYLILLSIVSILWFVKLLIDYYWIDFPYAIAYSLLTIAYIYCLCYYCNLIYLFYIYFVLLTYT